MPKRKAISEKAGEGQKPISPNKHRVKDNFYEESKKQEKRGFSLSSQVP
jgi:hypothetical protein